MATLLWRDYEEPKVTSKDGGIPDLLIWFQYFQNTKEDCNTLHSIIPST
jgi:hypothetical protein